MSWLSDRLKEATAQLNPFDSGKTAATVRRDRVAAPPVQTVRQPKNTLTNNALTRGFSRTVDQLNPLDGGRTWQQRAPTNNRSAGYQLTHNGATNVAGGVVRAPVRFANTAHLAARQAVEGGRMATGLLTGNSEAAMAASRRADQNYDRFARQDSGLFRQGSFFKNPEEAKRGDLKTTATRIGGGTLETAATVVPVARGATLLKPTTNLVKALPLSAVEGAGYNAAASAGRQLADTGRIDRRQLVTDTAVGAALGPATFVGGKVAGKAIQSAAPRVRQGAQRTATAARQAKRDLDIRTTPKIMNMHPNERYVLSDYANYKMGRYKPENAAVVNQLIREARAAGQKAGIDVTSGSPRDIDLRIADFLDSYDRAKARVKQGGYAKNPFGGADPQQPPRKTPTRTRTAGQNKQQGSVSSPDSIPVQTQPMAPPVKPPVTQTAVAAQPMLPAPKTQAALASAGGDIVDAPPAAIGTPRVGKKTRYASKTVPKSEFVSEQVRRDVKAGAPEYNVQTERARYTDSLSRLKAQGDDAFEQDLRTRLDAPNGKISGQDVADAQTIAAIMDAKGDAVSIRKATEIYERLSEHLTAAGQTVQAAAILSRRTPEGLRYWATKQLKQAGVKATPELQAQIKRLAAATRKAKNKDRAVFELTKLVNDNIPSSMGDRIINLWRAGLLTAPTTTGGNILGNAGEAAVRKAFVNPVATAADAVMGVFTGKRTQTLARPGAGVQGFKEGAKTLPDYLKTGYDPRDLGKKYEQTRELNYGDGPLGRGLGKYVNTVYRLMGTADAPFNSAAQREALSSIANAEAINRGLKGQAKARFVDEFMANPPEAAVNRAAQEADFATFKNPTLLGKAAVGLKRPLGPVGDFIVPFTQVPAAIATRLVQRTPIGIATEIVKQIRAVKAGEMFDQRAMAQAIGNGTFGIAAIGAGVTLAKTGQLTFGYPADAKERALWEAEGKQPYSVKVGNRWYSLNYLQPFGMLLAIGGQAQQDAKDGKNTTEVATKALATAGQAIQEQSFLKGINGILSAIADPERSAQQWMESTTSSVVPNVVRSFARASDDKQRRPETIMQGVMSGVPGLRQTTPTKDDLFGNPLPAKDNFANQYFNPLKPSIDRSGDPLLAEARRLQDANLGVITSQIQKDSLGDGTELDKKQIKELQANVGRNVNEAWNRLVATPKYQSLSDEDKSNALRNLSTDVLAVEKQRYAAAKQLGQYAPDYAGTHKKLTARQQAIANGNFDAQTYARPGGTQNSTVIKGDDRGTALLDKVGTLDKSQRDEWETGQFDEGFKDLYDRANTIRFGDLPDLPRNNKVLGLYADLLDKRASGDLTQFGENNAKLQFLKEAYKTDLPQQSREILSASTNDILEGVASGLITVDDVARAVQYDNILVGKGLSSSADIPAKVRNALGLGSAPGGSGGGSGGRGFQYKLYGFGNPLDTDRSLRQLIKQATL